MTSKSWLPIDSEVDRQCNCNARECVRSSRTSDAEKSMPIHFVGETIDKRRAHALAQTGDLVQ
jgi:hypothetical protein